MMVVKPVIVAKPPQYRMLCKFCGYAWTYSPTGDKAPKVFVKCPSCKNSVKRLHSLKGDR